MSLFSGWGDDGKTTFCSAWFDTVWGVDISDLCYDHDAAFDAGTVALKIKGDSSLFSGVYARAERSEYPAMMKLTAVGMYGFVSSVGWAWWLVDKYKGRI